MAKSLFCTRSAACLGVGLGAALLVAACSSAKETSRTSAQRSTADSPWDCVPNGSPLPPGDGDGDWDDPVCCSGATDVTGTCVPPTPCTPGGQPSVNGDGSDCCSSTTDDYGNCTQGGGGGGGGGGGAGGGGGGGGGGGTGPSGLVLFGGSQAVLSTPAFCETWSWDGTSWARPTTTGNPPGTGSSPSFCYGGTLVPFGGGLAFNSDGPSMWTLNGAAWADVGGSPNAGPSYRNYQSVVALGGKVVLFGGFLSQPLNDTWTWDGTNWTQAKVASNPEPRYRATMSVLNGKAVLFGGQTLTVGQGGILQNTNPTDTWTWDGAAWTDVATSSAPPGRSFATMATLGNEIVLFGGQAWSADQTSVTELADTWVFDGSNWSQVTGAGPSARDNAAMAAFGGAVVLFGGEDANRNLLGDTWTFDGSTWNQVATSGPSARVGAALSSF